MGYCVIIDGKRPCIDCKEIKVVSDFYRFRYETKQGKNSMRYSSRCKACASGQRKLRYKSPEGKAKASIARKAWYEKNKENQKEYRKMRQKEPAHKANKAKAQRLRKARIRSGSNSYDPRIKDIYQLAMDTEKKLAACVECDDALEIKIHVDHIQPLKHGGKHVIENLQILSARDNLQKGSRITSATPKEVAPHG